MIRSLRKVLTLILLISITLNYSFAQNQKFDNSVFWEIKYSKSSKPSYIFGSIHLMDTTDIQLPIKQLKIYIDRCKILCTETGEAKIGNSSGPKPNKEFIKSMFLQDSKKNISNSLDKEHLEKLILIMDSAGMNLKSLKPALDRFKPSALAFMIQAEQQIHQKKFETLNFSPEGYFTAYAKNSGHKIAGLETMQQQIDWTFKPNLPFEEGLKLLNEAIDKYSTKAETEIDEAYKLQKISKFFSEDIYKDVLMIERNRNMTEGIIKLMRDNPTFVIVGAAHLSYNTGILNLLSERGYKVKPIKIKIH